MPSPAHPRLRFPPAWLWLVDEAIPAWVKRAYSPRESWKDKPFAKEDAQFFFKGISELSDMFTEDRPRDMPAYFAHPKFRSSYLLYFLPLQAAKFIALFEMYPQAMQAVIKDARAQGAFRIVDLGAGPGTASIAFLVWLLGTGEKDLPPVELDWVDTQKGIMEDGRALADLLANSFPRLRGKIQIRIQQKNWWQAEGLPKRASLTLLGHVLNESPGPSAESSALARLFAHAGGGGVLLVEPAARRPSQLLAQARDLLLETHALARDPGVLWGPCLHAEKCPLAEGRDWCHFSMPADIPGKWFKQFSKNLGSERHWLKFSYLWFSSSEYPATTQPRDLRRVISDPLNKPGARSSSVLVCEPEQPLRFPVDVDTRIQRGDLIRLRALESAAKVVKPVKVLKEEPAGSLSGASGKKSKFGKIK